jgi:tryptophan-rich sensory protein
VTGRLRALLQFPYDFVVGDDWRVAVAVIVALALTYAVSTTSIPAWPILPAAVAIILPVSLWRPVRR